MNDDKTAVRGTFAIAAAKIYFVLAGFGLQFALPRFLGSAERFGLYSVALSGVSILNNVLIAATVQTVSKLVSESDAQSSATLRRALGLSAGVGLVLATSLALLAYPIAGANHDAELVGLMQVASFIVLGYSIYAALVGALNGSHRFVTQARFDATFTTIRTGLLLAGAAQAGVAGAVGGFACAAVGIAVLALGVVGMGTRPSVEAPGATYSRFFAFMGPIWVYQGFLNGLLQLDIWVIKNRVTAIAIETGATVDAARELANVLCGYYRAAQNFSFVPYQLVLTATLVVFPMVSRATASGDHEAARAAIRGAARFSWLSLLAMAAPMAGAASGVLSLVYKPDFVAGTPALAILAWALVAFALFVLAATILAGAGRPAVSAVVAAIALVSMLIFDRIAIDASGANMGALVAVATGTSAAMMLAASIAIGLVWKLFGTFIPLASVARGGLGALAGAAAAHFVPHASRLMAVVALAAGVVAYLAVLGLTGELRDVVAALRARVRK